jgi:hypothetical protein
MNRIFLSILLLISSCHKEGDIKNVLKQECALYKDEFRTMFVKIGTMWTPIKKRVSVCAEVGPAVCETYAYNGGEWILTKTIDGECEKD